MNTVHQIFGKKKKCFGQGILKFLLFPLIVSQIFLIIDQGPKWYPMIKDWKAFSSWEQRLLTACYLEKYIQDTQKDVRLSESVFSNSWKATFQGASLGLDKLMKENSTCCHVSFFFFFHSWSRQNTQVLPLISLKVFEI